MATTLVEKDAIAEAAKREDVSDDAAAQLSRALDERDARLHDEVDHD